MPKVNPDIMVWARETAGLTREEAARRLGLRDSRRSSAAEKLAAIEDGEQEPSRPQLVRMAERYRRPLLTFYLSRPPRRGSRGADFRTLSDDVAAADEALLDALMRDMGARQSMVRAVLEDEDEAVPLRFVGSLKIGEGASAALNSLRTVLGVERNAYRRQPNASAAFDLLRAAAEESGVFVLLKGDLGNHVTEIASGIFRGFAIADEVAPFVVINDRDARAAWSFTLLHEMVHLLLGQTGVSNGGVGNEAERFCNDVAGEFLLPLSELDQLAVANIRDVQEASKKISRFADERNVSRTMVDYRAYRSGLIDRGSYDQLRDAYLQECHEQRERDRVRAREQETSPSYYTVRRHRLGDRITNLIRRMMAANALSTSRSARILGVKPRQVYRLLSAGRSL